MIETLEIPTMFKRGGLEDGFKVLPELTPGCEWVKDKMGTLLSIKLDGTMCKVTADPANFRKKLSRKLGELYFEVDLIKPHEQDKYIAEAYVNSVKNASLSAGYYVAIGPMINNNNQRVPEHSLIKIAPPEGMIVVEWYSVKILRGQDVSVQDFYDSLKMELEGSTVMGLVFNWEEPIMTPHKLAQVTRKDFGFSWPIPEPVANELTDPYFGQGDMTFY